jgi:hypothetical protein
LSTLILLRTPCCIPLHSTVSYTQEGNKTLKNKLELVNLILLFIAFHLCQRLRVSTWSWLEQLCLEPVTINLFVFYNQDSSSYPCHLDFFDSININTCYTTLYGLIETSESTIHLPFSITSYTSMARLPLTLLWCMVHRSQVLVDPSSTTILIHTSLHVFDNLMLVILCYDVDEYVFIPWIYSKIKIDMNYMWSILCSSFSLDEILLIIWHSKCVIKLAITYVLKNE